MPVLSLINLPLQSVAKLMGHMLGNCNLSPDAGAEAEANEDAAPTSPYPGRVWTTQGGCGLCQGLAVCFMHPCP